MSSFSSMAVPTIFGIVVDALATAPDFGAAEDDILRVGTTSPVVLHERASRGSK